MPDCYLHIGTHKAGSTTIQEFLTANRQALRALGYYLPEAGTGRSGSGHPDLARDLAGNEAMRGETGGWNEFAAELRRLSGEHIIISSELFEPMMRKPQLRQEIAERLNGYRIKAIVYLRPQADYINSAYSTQVKLLAHASDFRSFIEAALDSGRYDYWKAFGGLFGDPAYLVDARPFNRATTAGGLCRDFLKALGLGPEQAARFEEGPRLNVSPGPKVIEAALRLRRAVDEATPPLQRNARHALGRFLIKSGEDRGWNRESFRGLDISDRERIRARFAASNDRLARTAWGKDWDQVFGDEPPPRPMNVFRYEDATAEERREFDDVLGMALARLKPRARLLDRARRFLARSLRRFRA